VGVRKGTPAETAGFRKGDILVSVDGNGIGDSFTLAQRLLPKIGEEVEFVVRRGADTETLRVTPQLPEAYVDNFGPGSPVPLECLGIAFDVRNVVADVVPGSPADLAGLQAKDKILEALFLVDGQISGEPIALVEKTRGDQMRDLPNWAYVHSVMNALPTSQLRLTYQRNGKAEDAETLTPESSEHWYHASRRLNTMPFSSVRTASSWSESWALGYRETTESLKQIVVLLQRVFTGKISFFKNVGGPIMIAQAAGAEASKGISRLLLFLTFLSANLAILNFLPIPALDGGHMLFLAAEGIRGKPVNERLQVALTLIGVGCLLSLMAVVFALDIQRLGLFNWIR
jgi:regulator of sigma E protease